MSSYIKHTMCIVNEIQYSMCFLITCIHLFFTDSMGILMFMMWRQTFWQIMRVYIKHYMYSISETVFMWIQWFRNSIVRHWSGYHTATIHSSRYINAICDSTFSVPLMFRSSDPFRSMHSHIHLSIHAFIHKYSTVVTFSCRFKPSRYI